MLLVAGAGLALVAWRGILSMPIWQGFPDSLQWYYFQALGSAAFLTPLSLTLLIIALKPPRPPLRRIASEPAAVVGFSTLFVLTLNTVLLVAIMSLVGWSLATFTGGKVFYFCRLLAEQTGMAVGSVWCVLAIGGRCRKPKSWMDFSGWGLGLCWMILAVISILFTLL
jgi:hypothetical protein